MIKNNLIILLIEDNPDDVDLMKEMIFDINTNTNEESDCCYKLVDVQNIKDAREFLNENKVDLILLDLSLSDSRGEETIYKFKDKVLEIPIIILTGLNDKSIDYKAMQLGIQDYLIKGKIDYYTLMKSIMHSMERFNLYKKLEYSNQELEQFTNILVHDLKNPLNVLISYLRIIKYRYKDKIGKEGIELTYKVMGRVKKMITMINNLLSYSEITNHNRPLKQCTSEFCLKAALENLEVDINTTNAKITYEHLPKLLANETLLTSIFYNLIGNGIKYCKKGQTPQIHVSVKENENEWLFSVKDNGIGIDNAHKDKIFMIFNRLHNKDIYLGYGILI